tara:strand:+ start:174 stop:1880 length:1707 start_codon:yes stop_codon:yes gene_type:complete
MSFLFKNTVLSPFNFSYDKIGANLSYEKIQIYNNRAVIEGVKGGEGRLILGLCTNPDLIVLMGLLVNSGEIVNQPFMRQLFTSNDLDYGDGLLFNGVTKFSKRLFLELPEEPSNSLYLFMLSGNEDDFSFYGYELLRADKAVSNGVVDLRSKKLKVEPSNKQKYTGEEIKSLYDNDMGNFFQGYTSINKDLNVELFLSLDLLKMLKKTVRHPNLITNLNYKTCLRGLKLLRNTVLGDKTDKYDLIKEKIDIVPLKLGSSNTILYYEAIDKTVYPNQMYDYDVEISIQDKTPDMARKIIDNFINLTSDLEKATNKKEISDFMADAMIQAPKVLALLNYDNTDYDVILKTLQFNTDIDLKLKQSVIKKMKDLLFMIRNKQNLRFGVYSANCTQNIPPATINYKYNIVRSVKTKVKNQSNLVFSQKNQLTSRVADKSLIKNSVVTTMSPGHRVMFSKEKVISELNNTNLITNMEKVDNKDIKLATGINVGNPLQKQETKKELGSKSILYSFLEGSSTMRLSYLKGHWASSTSEQWELLTALTLENIINDDANYLVRVENSQSVYNKYFILG